MSEKTHLWAERAGARGVDLGGRPARAGADPLRDSPRMAAQRARIGAAFGPVAQRANGLQDEEPLQARMAGAQAATASVAPPNETGMPNQLKAGIEALSGMDMSGVRVHRNSGKPAQLNALAYAQGNDIHLGPGQEGHLPHEAWHVVQQAQGRVRPTTQLAGVGVNDDVELEGEADVMGARALGEGAQRVQGGNWRGLTPAAPVQRKIYYKGRWYHLADKDELKKELNLPDILPGYLQAEAPFVLSSDGTKWIKDVALEFKGINRKDARPGSKETTGASLENPLGDVGFFGNKDKNRIGPKHLDRRVTKITLFGSAVRGNHWALECQVQGGQKTRTMKVDLIDDGYRILYGASQEGDNKVEFTPRALPLLPSVGLVYWLFVKIAKEKGPRTGPSGYNCQDFALEMLSRLYVNEEDKLAEQREVREGLR